VPCGSGPFDEDRIDLERRHAEAYRTAVRALLVANRLDSDPGFIGDRLRARGYAFTECHREQPDDWPGLAGVDLVLSLGSEWSVYWEHVQDSVDAEAGLVRTAHEAGVPILGICFGGQIVSHTLGGSVERAPEWEVGWYDVDSPWPALAGTGPWFQWHYDRFSPPAGVDVIATSPLANQAYVIGRTLALQFHPEVTESIVGRWIGGGGAEELAKLGLNGDEMLDRTRREVGRSRRDAAALVDWFCETVAP
jgi:GMP synthase-like glutamine amidotransferase